MELLIMHAAATWFMVGLIWVIQVVHYPLFAAVGTEEFVAYERGHTRRMGTLLVVPAVLEIVTAGLVAAVRPEGVTLGLGFGAGALLAFIWILTGLVQARRHAELGRGFDGSIHRRLVLSNWLRTTAWTARGILAAVMLL